MMNYTVKTLLFILGITLLSCSRGDSSETDIKIVDRGLGTPTLSISTTNRVIGLSTYENTFHFPYFKSNEFNAMLKISDSQHDIPREVGRSIEYYCTTSNHPKEIRLLRGVDMINSLSFRSFEDKLHVVTNKDSLRLEAKFNRFSLIDNMKNPYFGNVVSEIVFPTKEEMPLIFGIQPGGEILEKLSGRTINHHTISLFKIELVSKEKRIPLNSKTPITVKIGKASMGGEMNALEDKMAMPLWYFDEELGTWTQRGMATPSLKENAYIAQIDQTGWWIIDQPDIAYEIHRIQTTDAKNYQLPYATITISGENRKVKYTTNNKGAGYYCVPSNMTSLDYKIDHYTIFKPSKSQPSEEIPISISNRGSKVISGESRNFKTIQALGIQSDAINAQQHPVSVANNSGYKAEMFGPSSKRKFQKKESSAYKVGAFYAIPSKSFPGFINIAIPTSRMGILCPSDPQISKWKKSLDWSFPLNKDTEINIDENLIQYKTKEWKLIFEPSHVMTRVDTIHVFDTTSMTWVCEFVDIIIQQPENFSYREFSYTTSLYSRKDETLTAREVENIRFLSDRDPFSYALQFTTKGGRFATYRSDITYLTNCRYDIDLSQPIAIETDVEKFAKLPIYSVKDKWGRNLVDHSKTKHLRRSAWDSDNLFFEFEGEWAPLNGSHKLDKSKFLLLNNNSSSSNGENKGLVLPILITIFAIMIGFEIFHATGGISSKDENKKDKRSTLQPILSTLVANLVKLGPKFTKQRKEIIKVFLQKHPDLPINYKEYIKGNNFVTDHAFETIKSFTNSSERHDIVELLIKLAIDTDGIKSDEWNFIWKVMIGLGLDSDTIHSFAKRYNPLREDQDDNSQEEDFHHQSKGNTKESMQKAKIADFATLGINPNADLPEVKKAYKRLARMYHPDLPQNNGNIQFCTKKMAEINAAYDRIMEMLQ